MSTKSPLPPGCSARYRPERLLGQGSFGAVWRATQLDLNRPVAIKVVTAAALEDPEQRERFRNEARITAALTHPNIVQVLDHGVGDDQPWIAFELVEGQTLRDLLRPGGLPLHVALDAARDVLAALEHAHARGVLHRDVKPENVLLSDTGSFKVTDFGIAKWEREGAVQTRTGVVLGTPFYMSPEQIAAGAATPASDQYAWGALLYELLGGAPPFVADQPLKVLELHMRATPRPLAHVPSDVNALVMRTLAKDPAARFPSTTAALAALEGLRARFGTTTGALPRPPLAEARALAGPSGTQVSRAVSGAPEQPAPGPAGARTAVSHAGPPDPGRAGAMRPPRSRAAPALAVAAAVVAAALTLRARTPPPPASLAVSPLALASVAAASAVPPALASAAASPLARASAAASPAGAPVPVSGAAAPDLRDLKLELEQQIRLERALWPSLPDIALIEPHLLELKRNDAAFESLRGRIEERVAGRSPVPRDALALLAHAATYRFLAWSEAVRLRTNAHGVVGFLEATDLMVYGTDGLPALDDCLRPLTELLASEIQRGDSPVLAGAIEDAMILARCFSPFEPVAKAAPLYRARILDAQNTIRQRAGARGRPVTEMLDEFWSSRMETLPGQHGRQIKPLLEKLAHQWPLAARRANAVYDFVSR